MGFHSLEVKLPNTNPERLPRPQDGRLDLRVGQASGRGGR